MTEHQQADYLAGPKLLSSSIAGCRKATRTVRGDPAE
jgi:hypothetical protein